MSTRSIVSVIAGALAGPLAGPLAAQDGGQLYALHCAACHAADGRGATEGNFPPLAGSPWVLGDPALSVKIILNGLDGPVEVLGRTYNLAMPPQGAVLSDEEVSAILSFVRSSWGNSAPVVTTAAVRAIRAASEARKQPWTADELLAEHPLPKVESVLKNMTSRVYLGRWDALPDFSKLVSENFEEEQEGIVSLSHGFARDHFGMVWEADFEAPVAGQYTFRFDVDDVGRVIIGGKTVVEILSGGPMDGSREREASVVLAAGSHRMRVEMAEFEGGEGISLGYKGPEQADWRWLSDRRNSQMWPNIPIQPPPGKTAVYRNFIGGTTPRAIGFGFGNDVNFAYSADHFGPELFWRGNFMDGGRHWTDRGVGDAPPAGERIVKLGDSPTLATAGEIAGRWPDKPGLQPVFRGYKLDESGNPTLSTEAAGLRLLDTYQATSGAVTRRIRSSGKPAEPLVMLLARGLPIEVIDDRNFIIGGELGLSILSPKPAKLLGGDTLVMSLVPDSTVEIRYSWLDK